METETSTDDAFSVARIARIIERRLAAEPYTTLAVAGGVGFVLGRGLRHYLLGTATKMVMSWVVGPLIDELKSE